jgi:streptogramin lyase
MIISRTLLAACLFLITFASAATADTDLPKPAKPTSPDQLPSIRPGQSGEYPTYVAPPQQAKAEIIGTLRGRQIRSIESPAHVSGMGKYMAVAPDGDIWYVESREDKAVRINPRTLTVIQYYVPKGAAPYSIAIDSKGVAWMTGHGIEMLLELRPDEGVLIAHQPPSHGFVIHINIAQDDTVWFTQPGNNQIVSFRKGSGFTEYPAPTKQSGPGRHDFDAAGNVWFPELYTDKLAKLDIATGKITEWDMPTKNGLPAGVRVDHANNDAVWINEPMADKLAVFRNGAFVEYQVPTKGSVVSTNVTDELGNIWYTEGGWRGSAGGNKVGWLDPRSGEIEEFYLPYENSQPLGMVNGKDGSIWFSLVTGGHVCQILPSGWASE